MPTVFKGRVFTVEVNRVRLPKGGELDMEVVRHRGSVVLIPMPDADHVVLIRQYRYVLDRWIWELPAGSLDPGEDPEAAAARECEEEIGLVPARVTRLGALYPTPGYSDEVMIYYRLEGLSTPRPDSPHRPDEDEQLEPKTVTIAEARAMLARGDIVDMKTAYGLTLL